MRALIGFRDRIALPLLVSALAMVGCSTGAAQRPSAAAPSDQIEAEHACLFAALDTAYHGGLFSPYTVDRDAYARCMAARGYPVTTK